MIPASLAEPPLKGQSEGQSSAQGADGVERINSVV